MTDRTPPNAPSAPDRPQDPASSAPQEEIETSTPEIRETRLDRRISLIWLAPLAALALAGGLAWRDYKSRGVAVTVSFETASGVEAGSTKVKHRDVEVGLVERVGFTENMRSVALHIRMSPEMEPYLNDTTQFWIVRPRISASGISGLETVLSGAYVEMDWGEAEAQYRRDFAGLADPPLTPTGTPGMRILLRASEGGAGVGAPILFRRIPVGRIETQALTEDGTAVEMQAFVNAPHHERLSRATRFWNASGLELELGADGVRARVESLASLLEGGIAFDTLPLPSAAHPAQEGDAFTLYAGEQAARESLFDDATGAEIRLAAAFEESVRGLTVGAPVEYRGVRIGEVTAVSVRPNPLLQRIDVIVTMVIQPARLGLESPDAATTLNLFSVAVENGLRARLARGSLLTGSLFIELAEDPTAPYAQLDLAGDPYPTIPSGPSSFQALTDAAQEILTTIRNLPLAETVETARDAIQDMRDLIASDGVQGVPRQIAAALDSAQSAAEGAAKLLADPALAALPARLDAIGVQGEQIAANLAGLTADPALKALPGRLDALTRDAGAVAANLAGIAASPAFSALPERVEAIATEAQRAVANVAALTAAPAIQGLPQRIDAIAADAGRIAANLAGLTADPALLRLPLRIESVVAKVEAFAIEDLLATARAGLEDVRRLIASEGIQNAPARLSATLDQARNLLAEPAFRQTALEASAALAEARALLLEIRSAGTTQNLNAALASVQGAGRSIDAAAAALPATLAQITAAAARAENMLADFGPGAPGNYELVLTLRELRAAAGKLYELTDTLQRQPNSIIFGK